MQIRIVPQSSVSVTMGKAPKIKSQSLQVSGSVFGAQCKVTISKEGRKLSEQSKEQTQTAKSAQSARVEKKMLRQQEQAKQSNQQADALKSEYADLLKTNEYAELLKNIKKSVKSTNNYCLSKADRETIEKKMQLLREIGDQKQKQLEENQKQAAYAQEMAMQSSKSQDEIDKNNRDLLIMLKSIEESEKAEEENGGKAEENSSDGTKTKNSVSDAIQDSAAQFTASSIRRELDVTGMIYALNAEGHDYINRANEIAGNAYNEAEGIKTILADKNYTMAEKKEAVFRFGAQMIGAYDNPVTNEPNENAFKELEILADSDATDDEKEEALAAYRAKMREYSDLGKYRNRGVQMIKDSKEGKLLHISNNPLQGMEETKGIMMQSAVDAAFNSASQGTLDEASQELEDAVEELIEERNDITHVDSDEKKEEERKEIGELLGTEEEEDEKEQTQEMNVVI